jgi:hypothetical protein
MIICHQRWEYFREKLVIQIAIDEVEDFKRFGLTQ